MQFTGQLQSKLPHVGTSIFAIMSKLAGEHNAINLSQGFPDFPISEELIELVGKYMRQGLNQYAPMPGAAPLREAIARKTHSLYGATYSPDNEITVTAGGTQALYTAITALVKPGDEVIVIEPAYDSYIPAIQLCGATPVPVHLRLPNYHVDWQEIEDKISSRTSMIIINSPHNPSGSVLRAEDLNTLARLVSNTRIIVLSDEVYEHIIFDGIKHQSVCAHPALADRSMVVCSFGKTFHATGWKMGYCIAPANLTSEFRKVHQFVVFCANTAVQHAIAEHLENKETYLGLSRFYQAKRDFFLNGLKGSRFQFLPSSGTYFQTLDYSAISDLPENEFAIQVLKQHKVASVPNSAFYSTPVNNHTLRFCFAKQDTTLQAAVEILAGL